jgi:Na+-transporting NADH:ubiquinone oxidoreductase subunit C
MVILVAAVLTTVALFLKPLQEHNRKVEKITDILLAAGIPADASNAAAIYEEQLIKEIGISLEGEVKSLFQDGEMLEGDARPFEVDIKALLKQIADYRAGKGEAPLLPLFHLNTDNGEVFVIPVLGKGLWGPIWGNVALKPDLNTVAGVSFDHKAETPGLGAEINQDFFEKQFIGKKILDEDGNLYSVKVVKGGVANSTTVPMQHGVDGISGGTITSNGVTYMLEDCLKNYEPYIKKQLAL